MGVFEAWKAGKQIQWRISGRNGKWRDCEGNQPYWEIDNDYRVKPEPVYLEGRHYVACLKDSGTVHYIAGVVRYEGQGMFSRHKTSIQVPIKAFAWINPDPIALVRA